MGWEGIGFLVAGVSNFAMSNLLTVCFFSFSWAGTGELVQDICGLEVLDGLNVLDGLEDTNKLVVMGVVEGYVDFKKPGLYR